MRAYNPIFEQERASILSLIGIDPTVPASRERPASSQPAAAQQPSSAASTQGGQFGSRFSLDEWALIYNYANRNLVDGRSPRANTEAIRRFYERAGPTSPYNIPHQYAGALASQFRIPIESSAMSSWDALERNLRQILNQAKQQQQQPRPKPNISEIAQKILDSVGLGMTETEILRSLSKLRNQEDYEAVKQEFARISITGELDLEDYLQRFDSTEMSALRVIFQERNITPGFDTASAPTSEFDIRRLVAVEDELFDTEDKIRNYVASVFEAYISNLGTKAEAFNVYIQSEGETQDFIRSSLRDMFRIGNTNKQFVDSSLTALLKLTNVDFEDWYDKNY